ncbi:MAG TPA: hypothetical protein VJ438_02240 [Candidatus Nanoarchaeia archaeon]|nr:hypothetical protein [Candidatus Nanoarchaeia archaeon]
MIRTGRFHRFCKRCDKDFLPTGRMNYICSDCNQNKNQSKWLDALIKQQKIKIPVIPVEVPKQMEMCKFLKLNGYNRYCTHKDNLDIRSKKQNGHLRNQPKRCSKDLCPLLLVKGGNKTQNGKHKRNRKGISAKKNKKHR